jgi:uncharacterized protein
MTQPVPLPDQTSAFYWSSAAEGRLAVQTCQNCGTHHHPPVIACSRCQSEELSPTQASGDGNVYTFTVVRQAFDPAYFERIPYLVALIELDDHPSVRILSNLIGVDPADVYVGMPVEVTFEDREGTVLPMFQPRRSP